jgi:hypothetical protein
MLLLSRQDLRVRGDNLVIIGRVAIRLLLTVTIVTGVTETLPDLTEVIGVTDLSLTLSLTDSVLLVLSNRVLTELVPSRAVSISLAWEQDLRVV